MAGAVCTSNTTATEPISKKPCSTDKLMHQMVGRQSRKGMFELFLSPCHVPHPTALIGPCGMAHNINDNIDTRPLPKHTHWRRRRGRTSHRPGAPNTSPYITPHSLLLTRAASEHSHPHVPPNLALILAWTYDAVVRALGSLVK